MGVFGLKNKIGTVAAALVLGGVAPIEALADPMVFESPEAAIAALIVAIEARDATALVAVFGSENDDVVLTGDDVEDRQTWREFVEGYRTFHRIDPEGEDRATLYIGRDLWPFPAPLLRDEGGWSFDAPAAREEVRLRRIGQNELDVIDLMRKYVGAQALYRAQDADGDGLPAFAAGVLSTAGRRDGLYWPPDPDAPESPVGDFMARAAADGYNIDGTDVEPEPYLGYYFRVLTRQGPAAPGGEIDYLVNGHMLAGHALLAFPAAYGQTGIMTFMVGEAGVVYEADLGDDTLEIASGIDSFNPETGWLFVTDE